jgi:hypothetical protein
MHSPPLSVFHVRTVTCLWLLPTRALAPAAGSYRSHCNMPLFARDDEGAPAAAEAEDDEEEDEEEEDDDDAEDCTPTASPSAGTTDVRATSTGPASRFSVRCCFAAGAAGAAGASSSSSLSVSSHGRLYFFLATAATATAGKLTEASASEPVGPSIAVISSVGDKADKLEGAPSNCALGAPQN